MKVWKKAEGPEGWEAWWGHPEGLPGTWVLTLLYSCGPEASSAELASRAAPQGSRHVLAISKLLPYIFHQ